MHLDKLFCGIYGANDGMMYGILHPMNVLTQTPLLNLSHIDHISRLNLDEQNNLLTKISFNFGYFGGLIGDFVLLYGLTKIL